MPDLPDKLSRLAAVARSKGLATLVDRGRLADAALVAATRPALPTGADVVMPAGRSAHSLALVLGWDHVELDARIM